MSKIYIFCYDSDMTMSSLPEPIKAFLTKEAAQEYADKIYKVDHNPKEFYMKNWEIKELEFINE